MEILGVPIQYKQEGRNHTWSFELLGSVWSKTVPAPYDGELKQKALEQVIDRIKMAIQKMIVDTLYEQEKEKKTGKYFIKFFEKEYSDKPNVIQTIFCNNTFQKDGNISFWSDNDIVLKLKV